MIRLLTAFLILVATACGSDTPTAPSTPATAAELRAVPTSVNAGNVTLSLSTSLWRDFMPPTPQDGRPLVAVVRVQTADRSPVPTSIRATQLWVVFGDSVWSATPREERPRGDTEPDYEIVAREGPKWGPDVRVDVIVRLTDGARVWHVRASEQRIDATF